MIQSSALTKDVRNIFETI